METVGDERDCTRSVIGVIPLWDDAKDSVWMLPGYMRGLEAAGAVPVILPLTVSTDVLKRAAGLCDGFLFTGGHDVNPMIYGEIKRDCCGEICGARDQMETYIFREFVLNRNKPALGICRGIQFINAALGGSLYQDLPTEFSGAINHQGKGPPYDAPAHAVRVVQGSPLSELLEKERIDVNSFHHQGINRVAEGLEVMAWSDDGLAEAAYMPNHPYVWAVQWHPEFCPDDETSKKIFVSFVGSAVRQDT
jgi:putative glutamine amidotransferase